MFISLRWRLVAPLLALWAVGIVLLVSVVYASILERFQTLVEERADGIVAAVCSAAETARDPADLRRFLSSLGAARDVQRVALVAGRTPGRAGCRAASRPGRLDFAKRRAAPRAYPLPSRCPPT